MKTFQQQFEQAKKQEQRTALGVFIIGMAIIGFVISLPFILF